MSGFEEIAKEARRRVLRMNHRANASHTGSAFSIIEMLVSLYFKHLHVDPADPAMPARDKFILSKGHASSALYAVLSLRGFFEEAKLETFYCDNGTLPGHLDRESAPGIEVSSGSLGHGLSLGVGICLADKLKKSESKTVVLISDGELNEGSIWEPILLAPHLGLKNLTLIIDYNKIQSFGRTNEVINLEPLAGKLKEFNWDFSEINGHDFDQIDSALNKSTDKPKMILMHTVKGKGVSFMEDKLEWHYRSPNKEALELALKELA